jgi:hypothetical protein
MTRPPAFPTGQVVRIAILIVLLVADANLRMYANSRILSDDS